MARPGCKVYVGNLPSDITVREIEDLFYKYGNIEDIDLKNRKGPPFAFVEFFDERYVVRFFFIPRDAADAVQGRDGYNFDGYTLRVEFPRGPTNNRGRGPGRSGPGNYSGFTSNRAGGPSRRSEFRVIVSGLPPTGSWQDLKDHMREAGDVGYADVFRGGTGVVEFLRYEDMKYAIRKLNDSKFRSHEERPSRSRSRSYAHSRSRSFSPR